MFQDMGLLDTYLGQALHTSLVLHFYFLDSAHLRCLFPTGAVLLICCSGQLICCAAMVDDVASLILLAMISSTAGTAQATSWGISEGRATA